MYTFSLSLSLSLSLSSFIPISHEGQVRHYHIKDDEEKKYFISEKHRFPTITELIEYHKLNGGGLSHFETIIFIIIDIHVVFLGLVTRLRRPPTQLVPNQPVLSSAFGKLTVILYM